MNMDEYNERKPLLARIMKEPYKNEMSWDEINNVTKGAVFKMIYTIQFINDCVERIKYDYLDEIKKTDLYRHSIKKNLNNIDKSIRAYHGSMKYIHNVNMYISADIIMAYEEKTLAEFENLVSVAKKAIYSIGIPQGKRKFAAYALLMNSLCISSQASIVRFLEEFERYRSDTEDMVMFMDIDPIYKYSKDIYVELTGSKIDDDKYKKVNNMLQPELRRFFRKIWSPEVQDSINEVDKRSIARSYGI